MNTQLNRRFYGLLGKYGIDKVSACLVASAGRTESSRELTDDEAKWFCNEGYRLLLESDHESKKDKKRKQLIAMSYSIGEDPQFVKEWCEKYGVGSGDNRETREFNEYTLQELYALVVKFQKVVDDRIKSVGSNI
ncbi:hypothetical protein ElyMa_002505700 [Elysia marginata]|uniref:Uncharacterized protein n=1 Tax=Elysia marginata TaxID=1093978 RepID=A0AAV4GRR8_9GAST|nr:hypothetical protein ElyMa_002505700 [Elysia marginata]